MARGTKGYIKFYRQIQDCWIWDSDEPFDRRSAWSDLLLFANHADKKILFEGNLITIHRSQYMTSIRKLANRWKWSPTKVTHFLELLEQDNMIIRQSDSKKTLITIINYDIYQGDDEEEKTLEEQLKDAEKTVKSTNKNEKNDKEEDIYITRFEETYKIYPRKGDKKRAYSCYQARLKEGYSEDELFAATKNYADYCRRENREQKYIKLATTFFGVNTPFVDYLPKGSVEENMEDGYLVYPIDEYEIGHENPPYFGFPEKWFENGKLIEGRIKPIRQPANIKYGTTKPVDYNVAQLVEMYNGRRIWYEQEHNGG